MQRQEELCEFEASLLYRVRFQDNQSYSEKPCLGVGGILKNFFKKNKRVRMRGKAWSTNRG